MIISIPTAIQQSFREAVDTFTTNIISRPCTLYYPPVQVPCPNLNQPGDFAGSYAFTGDPQFIHSQQLCPLCNGTNFIQREDSFVITMAIYWKASQFSAIFPADFRQQAGVIQTKGFCKDINTVLNCARMEAYQDLGTDHYQFKLIGEPVIPGKVIPSTYFYSLWKRI